LRGNLRVGTIEKLRKKGSKGFVITDNEGECSGNWAGRRYEVEKRLAVTLDENLDRMIVKESGGFPATRFGEG
jgi:hypothetical protein